MILRPCPCGAIPAITESYRAPVNIVRVECPCGKRGATLMYTKPEDAARMKQAAADGWNLAE